jgi:hypothetical protein
MRMIESGAILMFSLYMYHLKDVYIRTQHTRMGSCHPQEVADAYESRGYDFIAFTDQ